MVQRTAAGAGDPAEPTLQPRMATSLGGLTLANPVMPASGCFGPELASITDVGQLGAVVTKTVFAERRAGNPAHRLDEASGVMLNSVGIPSPGVESFLARTLPRYLACGPPTIVSVGGLRPREYWDLTAALLEDERGAAIAALEVNVSCPNLESGHEVGVVPSETHRVVRGVVARAQGRPVLAKLTPNVHDIGEIARAAQDAGADAVTVGNTLVGMTVDRRGRGRPVLGNVRGGVSGPAIKPIMLRLAWEAARAVTVPVVGCGGISRGRDAFDYLASGCVAVQVGTATFARPDRMLGVRDELAAELGETGFSSVVDVVGSLEVGDLTTVSPEGVGS